MAYISQLKLGNTTYDIKDAEARQLIEQLGQSDITFRGYYNYFWNGTVWQPIYSGTKDEINIGATPKVAKDSSGTDEVTLTNGDIIIYKDVLDSKDLEYITVKQDDGTYVLNAFGYGGALKALAFKDDASGTTSNAGGHTHTLTNGATSGVAFTGGSYTPEGTVTLAAGTGAQTTHGGSFSGTEGDVEVEGTTDNATVGSHSYTPAGTITQPTFTGDALGTHDHTVSVTVAANANGNYTPAGTVSKPTFTGTEITPTVTNNKVTSESATPGMTGSFSGTAASHNHTGSTTAMVASVSGEVMTFTTGTVSIENKSITPAGTVSVTGGAHTHGVTSNVAVAKFTPAGTLTAPTFSGTKVLISADATAASAGTPTGIVSKPTFSGTAATLAHTAHSHGVTLSGKFTPAGTVSITGGTIDWTKLTAAFSGKAKNVTGTITQGTVTGTISTIADHNHTVTVQ